MKLKEVCSQTGLTQKTVRFYEEKNLIIPNSIMKNGRSYRDYTQENVKALQEIAILRKALFSLEEIYLMQQDPDEIPEILQNYTERICEMAAITEALSNTAKTLDTSTVTDIFKLARAMDPAAKTLPLPSCDLKPSFRRIEDAETAELTRLRQDKAMRAEASPFFLEQQQFTNRLGLFNEHYKHNTSLSGGTANFPKPEEPKLIRYLNLFLSGLILISTLSIVYFLLQHKVELVALWNNIKYWIIPLDASLLIIRLLVPRFYYLLVK